MNDSLPFLNSTDKIVRVCDRIISWGVLALTALVPLFFLPWTIEVIELNKQLLVITGATVVGMAWLGKMLAERKFEYRRSVVNLFVILYVAAYGIGAWNSESRYISMMGDFGQEMSGFVTVASFAVLYFVITNNFKDMKAVRGLLMATVLGGFVTGLYALLQGLGVHILPFAFAKAPSFNTVGTMASLGIYIAFITTLCGGLMLADRGGAAIDERPKWLGQLENALMVATSIIGILIVGVVDYWPVSLALFLGSAMLIGFAFVHAGKLNGIGGVLMPIAALIISGFILVFPFPVRLGFPAEVMPSMKSSFQIAVATLRENPMFGSGPGTFIYDYAKHHATDVNSSQFWNVRFDRGASRFLTGLATTGFVGTLSWLLVALLLAWSAGQKLMKTDEDTWHLLIGVFASYMVLLISRFTYSESMTLEWAFWLAMAVLVVSHRREFFSVKFEASPRSAMAVSFIFILGLVFAMSGLFIEGTRYAAEIAYANAIRNDRAGGNPDETTKSLLRAVNLNGDNEVFRRNLALAYLGLANKALTDAPALTQNKDEKKEDYEKRVKEARATQLQKVSQYTALSVNIAKAVTDVAPNNIANWSVLAGIYQGLMGVTDEADTWAIKSYEEAIKLEPNNPEHYTELAKVYLWQSDRAKAATDTKDDKVRVEAQKKVDELLGKGIDKLNQAIALKADYAPAHYNMSLAMDRQGKLKEAIGNMENTYRINPQDIGVPFQLALLYYRDGRKDTAIQLLESVVQRVPTFSNARWFLASMYEEKGRYEDALAQVDEVAKQNPDNDAVKQKQTDLAGKKSAGPGLPTPIDQPTENQNQPNVKR